mmetsp:Transcript_67290/g.196720  ORF Transcript_67290/g.196720 Transcript_67290/m.196720 type:complete len:391 (+) Transcript_67290:22-1194(+)
MARLLHRALPEEEASWHVGGRYRVRPGCCARLRVGPDPQSRVFRQTSQNLTLLYICRDQEAPLAERVSWSEVPLVGLVHLGPADMPGWITLESPDGRGPLLRRRGGGSWEVGGRYVVKRPIMVQSSQDLSSEAVRELVPGEEVLSVWLDTTVSGLRAHLRMLVKTEADVIGWISLDEGRGGKSLFPLNLLGPKAVRLKARHPLMWLRSCRATRSPPYTKMPWVEQGQYRVLEGISLFGVMPTGGNPRLCKLAAGTLVTVNEVRQCEPSDDARRTAAVITVDDGPACGQSGWLYCVGRDGRDILDRRNQHERDEILRRFSRLNGMTIIKGRPVGNAAVDPDRMAIGSSEFSVGRPVMSDGSEQRPDAGTTDASAMGLPGSLDSEELTVQEC